MPPPNRRYKVLKSQGQDRSSWSKEEREAAELKERLQTPVAEMNLPVRIINTLEEHDVILAEHLLAQTYESLMGMKNFGEKTLSEVRAAITALHLPVPVWTKPPKAKRPPVARKAKVVDPFSYGDIFN